MSARYGTSWLPARQPLFFRDQAQHGYGQVKRAANTEADTGDEHFYCRQCLAPLTSKRQGRQVLGKNRHVFANPEGVVFEIACFALAPGCQRQGRPTSQYSWFPPHAWCFALCRSCKIHVGWFYEAAGSSSFYGLILDRLVEK